MENKENILGYEKIGKLLKKFSIPCIISMLVNSLYNIVDQIFIGWGVGYLGNGATNIVFPITMICLAFALMFGDGSSAYLSLKLGEKKKEEAAKGVGNGLFLSIVVSIIIFLICIIFLPNILNIFGCTEVLREYALNYGFVITLGIPFMMIGTTLNSIIRAEGNPKYAMISMITGAVLNIILDPIFIFVFKMGVTGAAIATIISQIVTFLMNILYLKKFKNIVITKESLLPKIDILKQVSVLGISSFITQMSVVVVIAFENNLLVKYGANSRYGAEIPITVLGIVMKISQILNSIIIGIAAGAQPIFGYNYGAVKFDRVKKTLKLVLCSSLVISTIAFILFQTIPDKLIVIFGNGNQTYIDFACLAFKTYLMLCICNGVQIPASIFFQAIGKSGKSAFLSLSRQIVLLIPSMIILGKLKGIEGILYSGPVADGIAFVIATILIFLEVKKLNKNSQTKSALSEEENLQKSKNTLTNHIVITISREYGSGGRYIGELISEKLGIKLYDKDIIKEISEKTGMSEEYIKNSEQKRNLLDNFNSGYYIGMSNSDEIFITESNIIKEIADRESCVIIGRCSDFILKDREDVTNIFVYNDMPNKIKRVVDIYKEPKEKVETKINKINKLRANHYEHYTNNVWGKSSNYDLCINSDILGVEKSAEIICQFVKNKYNI